MKKLGTTGLKILKISHLLFAIMWIGGVMALVSLQFGVTPETKETMYMAAINHLIVDDCHNIRDIHRMGVLQATVAYGKMDSYHFVGNHRCRLHGSDNQG